MSSFMYINAKQTQWNGTTYLDETQYAGDIKALLVMSNTTADTDTTAATISGFGTLDEFDGAGYARLLLTTRLVSLDSLNARAEFHAADLNFGARANGTRQIVGIVLFFDLGADANNIPLFYFDIGSSINPGGLTLIFPVDAEGLAQLA